MGKPADVHPGIVPFEDLQALCHPDGKPRRATVEAWARKQGIPYKYDGQGGIWTTIEAVNASLGIGAANDHSPYPNDII
jgi:hypothetical protein